MSAFHDVHTSHDVHNEWSCPDCGDVRVFVQPPCADGHGIDGNCPEWVCADCGTAVFAGAAPLAVRRAA